MTEAKMENGTLHIKDRVSIAHAVLGLCVVISSAAGSYLTSSQVIQYKVDQLESDGDKRDDRIERNTEAISKGLSGMSLEIRSLAISVAKLETTIDAQNRLLDVMSKQRVGQ